MIPVLLSFAWFPLFFVFMHKFGKSCVADLLEEARVAGDGSVIVQPSAESRRWLRLAFVLVPSLTLCSAAIYVWLAFDLLIWSLVILLVLAVVVFFFERAVRRSCVDACFDEERVGQGLPGAGTRAQILWSDVAELRFDSFSALYHVVGASSSSSATTSVKVFAFGRGVLAFESKAREKLGDGAVQAPFSRTARSRQRMPGFEAASARGAGAAATGASK